MSCEKEVKQVFLPHHEQLPLCTTRLPYRQGRSLKAIKAYSIVNESIHLLILGVPSLNLRQETKALFIKFGKLLQFSISKEHTAEQFTETYHAAYERIQSARLAKRFLDMKNFYGGTLHICYAPELETVMETRNKLLERQRDVAYRLKRLQSETISNETEKQTDAKCSDDITKLYMGQINTICYDVGEETNKKRKLNESNVVIEKKFKPCFIDDEDKSKVSKQDTANKSNYNANKKYKIKRKSNDNESLQGDIEIVYFTSVDRETITNINDGLNYNKFGNETVKVIVQKPLNKIRFNLNKKKDT